MNWQNFNCSKTIFILQMLQLTLYINKTRPFLDVALLALLKQLDPLSAQVSDIFKGQLQSVLSCEFSKLLGVFQFLVRFGLGKELLLGQWGQDEFQIKQKWKLPNRDKQTSIHLILSSKNFEAESLEPDTARGVLCRD